MGMPLTGLRQKFHLLHWPDCYIAMEHAPCELRRRKNGRLRLWLLQATHRQPYFRPILPTNEAVNRVVMYNPSFPYRNRNIIINDQFFRVCYVKIQYLTIKVNVTRAFSKRTRLFVLHIITFTEFQTNIWICLDLFCRVSFLR